jgi:uncharacterized membrane protein
MMPCVEARAEEQQPLRWGREEIEFSRIVAFSDGVFAIAITLLVLNLHIPEHLPRGQSVLDSLWDQNGDLLAYALSFAVIGRLWLVHHRFTGEITHYDATLMTLNLFYLGFVALIPFSSEVIGNHGGTTGGVIVYAVNLAIANFISTAMFLYAAQSGLSLERFQRYVKRRYRLRNFVGGVIFLVSIPVAVVSPTVAVLIWLALFFVPGGDEGRRRTAGNRPASSAR